MKIQRNIFIRNLSIILTGILLPLLTACGSTSEPTAIPEPTPVPPTEVPTEAPTATPISPTEVPPTPEPEAVEEEEEAIDPEDAETESTSENAIQSVVGELTYPSLGNDHIPFGSRTPIEYNTVPPSSGPHYPNIIEWDIYDKPVPYELMVHNLEDGGVIVYYQCPEPCPELVQQLSDAIQPYLDYDWHVVMLPNDPEWVSENGQLRHLDMGAKIAVVAWQKVLKLDEFDSDRILLFLEAYEGIDHHKR